MSTDLVFIDWETTGLIKPEEIDIKLQPYGIEFYGMRINKNWETVSDFETLLKPPVKIPEFIEKLTGIYNSSVEDAPTFIEVYPDLIELFHGAETLVAHNCSFDRDILKFELMRHDLQFKFPWPHKHVCTVEASFSIRNKRLTISKLHDITTGEPHDTDSNAHRAKDDVLALIECYKWLQDQGFVD